MDARQTRRFTMVGLGEALYDVFPQEERLGGAPLNVAVHAHQLSPQVRGVVLSRAGDDPLGQAMRHELDQRGMSDEYLQLDPDRATGRVLVRFDANHQPEYEIVENAAWDNLQWDPQLEELARHCDAVCFGSLAQRDGQARSTIRRFLNEARHAIRLFDVNLRPPFVDRRIIENACRDATWVKCNHEELEHFDDWFGTATPQAIREHFELEAVVLTRGKDGTLIVHEGGSSEGEPAQAEANPQADAVGAGDSVSAAMLVARLQRWDWARTANLANQIGAFVAGQPGATPALPEALTQSLS